MPTVASTLYENTHSLHMEQSPVDQCPLLYNFLLIPCYLTLIGPATISLSRLMLSLTGLRSPPRSQLKGLLVTDWSLLTGYLELSESVLLKHHQRKTALKPHGKGPYQVLLTTDKDAKREGTELWVHIPQLRKAPPDIQS